MGLPLTSEGGEVGPSLRTERRAGENSAPRYEIPHNMPRPIANIVSHVAQVRGLTVAAVLGGSRRSDISAARREAVRRIRARGHSLPQIGRWLRLHHTSVLYHLRKGTNG